jgi:hypothetical protein
MPCLVPVVIWEYANDAIDQNKKSQMPIGWFSLVRRKHRARVTSTHRPHIQASCSAECRPRPADPTPVREIFLEMRYVSIRGLSAIGVEVPASPCPTSTSPGHSPALPSE